MSVPDSGIRIVQAVGILGSAFAAGSIFALSAFGIPTLLYSLRPEVTATAGPKPSPKLLANQWLQIYNKGKKLVPRIALCAALSYGYLARVQDGATWYYLPAIASTMGIVPYTFAIMGRVNSTLIGYAEQEVKEGEKPVTEDEVVRLLETWGAMNFVRALGPLLGSALGFYAAVVL